MQIPILGCALLITFNAGGLIAQSPMTRAANNPAKPAAAPTEPRYTLYKTENTWTFIELDTQTGRIWQVQFSVDAKGTRGKLPINDSPLVLNGRNGRFSLTPTNNMWNFILLDQDTGRTWQAQFAMEDQNRGIFSIISDEEISLLLRKSPTQ